MMFVRIRKASRYNFLLIISVLVICYFVGFVKAAEITWEFDGIVGLSNSGSIEGYFTHDSATQTLSNVNVKATVGGITYVITEAGAVSSGSINGARPGTVSVSHHLPKWNVLNSQVEFTKPPSPSSPN